MKSTQTGADYAAKLTQLESAVERILDVQSKTLTFKDGATSPNVLFGQTMGNAWGVLGLDPKVINAMVLPNLGLIGRLPVSASNELTPIHAYLTGVTAPSADKPTTICGPGPVPGNVKRGTVTWPFGRIAMSTKTVNLTAPVGAVLNRGQFRDLQLVGGPTDPKIGPNVPTGIAGMLNSEAKQSMFEFRMGWIQRHGRLLYKGDPSNNTYDGSGDMIYGEPVGLDRMINTGYRDAITAQATPSLDPKILNFGTGVTANPTKLVQQITALVRYNKKLANDAGLAPTQIALVGSEGLFYEITAVWPCAYDTYRCTLTDNGTDQRVISVDEQIKKTEDMRQGKYLLVDGQQVEWISDDSATETTGDNVTWTTSIYVVPLKFLGNNPGVYVQYFDFDTAPQVEFRNLYNQNDKVTTSDNGRFIWVRRSDGFCASMDAVERPRYVLDVPFLSARITNVSYTPLLSMRSGWNDDARFYNGGVYKNGPVPYFYSNPA
jgi:hypothetical protein